MNLIILTDADTDDGSVFHLADHRAEHIRSVLRIGLGDSLAVGRLNGPRGHARIEQIDGQTVTLSCASWIDAPRIEPDVDLICALPRPQTLRKVLVTAASMGVRRLFLIRANRVEKSYFHSPLLGPEKMTPYLIEGLGQGKLTRLPDVSIHARFRPFIEDFLPGLDETDGPSAIRLLPDPEGAMSLHRFYNGTAGRLIIAIGPEGGWVPFEVALMEQNGFQRFTLGRWTLRVETAVAATLGQIELLRMRRALR